jgi:hypothetical protein
MGCSGCGKRNAARNSSNIMEQYKYLNDRQIKARLEIFKRQHCKDCEKKSSCDYGTYVACQKNKKNE